MLSQDRFSAPDGFHPKRTRRFFATTPGTTPFEAAMLCSFLDRFRVGQAMIDLAFAGADALRVSTGFRDALKMCLPLQSRQVEPILPHGFAAAVYRKAEDCTVLVKEQWRSVL